MSTDDCSLVVDLDGREDDVARLKITARAAVNAKNAYWIIAQNRPEVYPVVVL